MHQKQIYALFETTTDNKYKISIQLNKTYEINGSMELLMHYE